jgi:hypothetical protein
MAKPSADCSGDLPFSSRTLEPFAVGASLVKLLHRLLGITPANLFCPDMLDIKFSFMKILAVLYRSRSTALAPLLFHLLLNVEMGGAGFL